MWEQEQDPGPTRSRRRGSLSDDPEVIARREWYSNLRSDVLGKLKQKEEEELAKIDDNGNRIPTPRLPDIDELNITPVKEFEGGMALSSLFESSTFIEEKKLDMDDQSQSKSKSKYDDDDDEDLSIASIPQKINVEIDTNTAKWLLRFTPEIEASMVTSRIICFHGLGGNAQSFRHWGRMFLDERVEVFGVSLPGRSNSTCNALGTSIEDLMTPLFDAFVKHRIVSKDIGFRVPKLIFFAHSVGCYVAFELARFLRRKGYENLISTLVVSSSKAPQIVSEYNSDKWNRFYFLDSAKDLITRLELLGGLPAAVKERKDLISVILSTLRKDYNFMEKYRYKTISTEPSKPLKCAIVTIATDNDETMTIEELAEWKSQSTGKHLHHVFRQGGHSYLFKKDYEMMVIQMLRQLLDSGVKVENIEIGQVVPPYAVPKKPDDDDDDGDGDNNNDDDNFREEK